ncbi:hypothetical protein C2G38_2158363 [Gigaspora rosea]|uniref:Uncharacterized protein n=1 Tax=Gigaspora rosea TaxID=44941 RepID=A0A397W2F8_9GLOM|nr:hypothetical protein C2G38_2158363 [Gigaspora rosea]
MEDFNEQTPTTELITAEYNEEEPNTELVTTELNNMAFDYVGVSSFDIKQFRHSFVITVVIFLSSFLCHYKYFELMEDFNKQMPTTELVTAKYNEDKKQMPTVTAKYNNDDIDIAEYFEESFRYNEVINVSNIDVEQISLKQDDFFTDFDEAKLRI